MRALPLLLMLAVQLVAGAVGAAAAKPAAAPPRAAVDFVSLAHERALSAATATAWPTRCPLRSTDARALAAAADTEPAAVQSYRCYVVAAKQLLQASSETAVDVTARVWAGLAQWLDAHDADTVALADTGLTGDEARAGALACWAAARRVTGGGSSSDAASDEEGDGMAVLSPRWHVLGPFPIGKTEVDAAPWSAHVAADEEGSTNGWWFAWPRVNASHPFASELVDGGAVRWTEVTADHSGAVAVNFPAVKWNTLVQALGSTTVLEWQAHVHADLTVTRAGRFTVHCTNLFAVAVDAHVLAADQYGRGHVLGAVTLARGRHVLHVRLRAKVHAQFTCRVQPVGSSPSAWIRLHAPPAVPDVVRVAHRGATRLWLFSEYLSVPLTNTADRWVESVAWTLGGAKNKRIRLHDTQPHAALRHFIAPGQVTFVPLRLALANDDNENGGGDGCLPSFTLTATVTFSDHPNESASSNTLTVTPRCRRAADESFVLTFVDHDGSVQHAAAVAPRRLCVAARDDGDGDGDGDGTDDSGDSDPAGRCPVVLSMHGTGVSANNMADSYKRMNKRKKWLFGVDGAWTLAPTRFGAHNWEYTGARTVTAALDALAALTARASRSSGSDALPEAAVQFLIGRAADASRVVVAGHSMGGHGAWLWAVTHPDRVLCAAPAAGWLRKERYGDSNREFDSDLSMAHTDASLQAVVTASVGDSHADLFVEHLVGTPVLARTGADDVTVHPYFNRRMARLLQAATARARLPPDDDRWVRLSEVRDKEHWFWDSVATNDGGVVNDKEMRKFFKACVSGKRVATLPQRFSVIATNPSVMFSRGGLRIMQQTHAMRLSRLDVDRGSNASEWRIATRNVRSFALVSRDTSGAGVGALRAADLPPHGVLIDGHTRLSHADLTRALLSSGTRTPWHVCRRRPVRDSNGPVWALCPGGSSVTHNTNGARDPDATGGPARHVFAAPWMVVVGTSAHTAAGAAGADARAAAAAADALYTRHAVLLANLHAMAYDSFVPVVRARDVLLPGAASQYNVVLIGSHALRQAFQEMARGVLAMATPSTATATATATATSVSGWEDGEGAPWRGRHTLFTASLPVHMPVTTTGKRDHTMVVERRLALVLCGLPGAVDAVMRLALPTIPPMVRAPFTNLLPDFVSLRHATQHDDAQASDGWVAGREIDAKGLGAVVSAGYWNAQWQEDRATSYMDDD